MKKNTNTNLILIAFLFLVTAWLIWFTVPKLYELYNRDTIIEKTDTVITEKHDTILLTDNKPYTEVKYKTIKDTLKTTDSIYVPIELPLSVKKYEGDTMSANGTKVHYRANISGYRQNLDSLWLDVIHKDSFIYKETIKYKNKRGFKIAPYAGIGFNPIEKNFVPTIGIGITYD